RFVGELPDDVLERDVTAGHAAVERGLAGDGRGSSRPHGGRARGSAAALDRPAARHRAPGRTVYHESFGRGVVVDAEGEGGEARFTVRFAAGVKKILGRFLNGRDDADQP